jgi:hypothetical protein
MDSGEYLNFEYIERIINSIDDDNWDMAKQIWIVHFIKYNKKPVRKKISLFGSEYDNFNKHIAFYQEHTLIDRCTDNCPNSYSDKSRTDFFFKKAKGKVELFFGEKKCRLCGENKVSTVKFVWQPFFILVEAGQTTLQSETIYINDVPQSLQLDNFKFQLLCTTLNQKQNHFYGVFFLNGDMYVVDDISRTSTYLVPLEFNSNRTNSFYFSLPIGTSFYYLE